MSSQPFAISLGKLIMIQQRLQIGRLAAGLRLTAIIGNGNTLPKPQALVPTSL
jgi:hypothetical protein